LDDYRIIIDNICNTELPELDNLSPLEGREVAVAGIVTAIDMRTTKDGRPWGRVKLEGYAGSHEFTLFSKDFEKFRQYIFLDYYLCIRGKVQKRPFPKDTTELEFRINSMTQLADMRDSIKELSVTLPLSIIDADFVKSLSAAIKKSKGKATLRITVVDDADNVMLRHFSRKFQVGITNELIDYLNSNKLKYTIS
jgi:DNA polymerase-3 subunit alpha